jgi:hypothetical protein
MQPKAAFLAGAFVLIAIACAMAAEPGVTSVRWVIFDTSFLQGNKGTPKLDDIVVGNLKETITLRGVFAAWPRHHAEIFTLIASKNFSVITVPLHPLPLKSFDENIYSDVVLRLKDDSLCRVQHSYTKDEGLRIRVVRDSTTAYIRPNKPPNATP